VWLGGVWLSVLLGGASLLALRELYIAFDKRDRAVHVLGYAATALFFVMMELADPLWALAVTLVFIMIEAQMWLVVFYGKFGPQVTIKEVVTTVYGFLYVPFLLGFAVMVRGMYGGEFWVWLIFLAAMGCDTFAYLTGSLLGRHKMTGSPSPSKSWEGIAGGIIGATLLGVAAGFAVPAVFTYVPHNWQWIAPLTVFIGAVSSVFGDLAASAVKRQCGIKDFGGIFPGHGGVMDRVDSIVLVAPMVYAMVWLLT
jgi:phosphatidate cytidylyltransferase